MDAARRDGVGEQSVLVTSDSEKLLSALCYVYGYVSSGVRSVLEQWEQRTASEQGRADVRAILARSAELLGRPLEELPGRVAEARKETPMSQESDGVAASGAVRPVRRNVAAGRDDGDAAFGVGRCRP